jgi:hypothetical protein
LGKKQESYLVLLDAEKEYYSKLATRRLNEIEERRTGLKYEILNNFRYHLPEKYKMDSKYFLKINSKFLHKVCMFFNWVCYEDNYR